MANPNKLLLEIARCPVVRGIRDRTVELHEYCQEIVEVQKDATTFQVPEPWVGWIEHAPILFISSNPSIDLHEVFPTDDREEWPDQRIIDFFQNRFSSPKGWVKDGKVLRRDGYSGRKVRFWMSAGRRASEVLQKDLGKVAPGVDFALTEVVHCKSRKEEGVHKARHFCTQRYLARILEVAAAKVLVVYGGVARDSVCSLPEVGPITEQGFLGPLMLHGTSRILIFLPHPSAWRGRKQFEPDELAALHSHLGSKPPT